MPGTETHSWRLAAARCSQLEHATAPDWSLSGAWNKSGLSVHNKSFRQYSAAYAEAKGVGRSEVDLMDTGEMLDSLRVLRQNGETLTIGYRTGSRMAKRAEHNQEGRTPRPFLGLNKRELRELENFVRDGQ